jgi:hypothetical protein
MDLPARQRETALRNKLSKTPILPLIKTIRGRKVILDSDLAAIYGVSTKALNQAVKRNLARFPPDFIIHLIAREVDRLKSQSAISSPTWNRVKSVADTAPDMRSQIVTASKRNVRFLPFAFTEHGAIMAAAVLNSPRAVQMSVFVVRAFVRMRAQLLERAELEKRLADIEKTLMAHNGALRDLYRKIRPLLLPPPPPSLKPIGFSVKEARTIYGASQKRHMK